MSVTSRTHGSKTGNLDFIDWDQAVIEAIGARLEPIVNNDPTGPAKNQYFLPLGGIFVQHEGQRFEIEKAQVVFRRPEPTEVQFAMPSVYISRDDLTVMPERLYSVVEQFRVPADGATPIAVNGVLGYSAYETKPQEIPVDFNYTIEVYSRYTTVAQMLLGIVMKVFPLRGKITVTDSIGNERVYAAYTDGVGDISELNTLVDRVAGYSLSVRFEGELTLDKEAFEAVAVTGPVSATPGAGVTVVPGALGYGTGATLNLRFKYPSFGLNPGEDYPT